MSPRTAYWLSSCSCWLEVGPPSSRARFLCFTTSKVFSISRSLEHMHSPSAWGTVEQHSYQLLTFSLNTSANCIDMTMLTISNKIQQNLRFNSINQSGPKTGTLSDYLFIFIYKVLIWFKGRYSLIQTEPSVSLLTNKCPPGKYPHTCAVCVSYLRVSTCLAEDCSEGNWVSLKISGGPAVGPLLVLVRRAPGGRYTPVGFDSGTSGSSSTGGQQRTDQTHGHPSLPWQ